MLSLYDTGLKRLFSLNQHTEIHPPEGSGGESCGAQLGSGKIGPPLPPWLVFPVQKMDGGSGGAVPPQATCFSSSLCSSDTMSSLFPFARSKEGLKHGSPSIFCHITFTCYFSMQHITVTKPFLKIY